MKCCRTCGQTIKPENHRQCNKCDKILDINMFSKNKHHFSGKNKTCRNCLAIKAKEWRKKQKEIRTFVKENKLVKFIKGYFT